jgi:hypothetical protein
LPGAPVFHDHDLVNGLSGAIRIWLFLLEHDPGKGNPVSRLREARFGGRR